MGRIICIDYGGKRTGIAVTDPMKIIASALTTIPTSEFIPFFKAILPGRTCGINSDRRTQKLG